MKILSMRYLSLVFAILTISFRSFAALPPILGAFGICNGNFTTLNNPSPGGVWTTSDASVATVAGSSGMAVVTAVSVGTANITYTVGADFTYSTVTVYPTPTPLTGTLMACVGASSTLGSTPAGGTWSTSNTTVATVNPTSGAVTGISAGTTHVTYHTSMGCYAFAVFTVNTTPTISGPATACIGSPAFYTSPTPGGTWSVAPSGVATIGSSGTLMGSSTGTAVISYTMSTGCSAGRIITVNASIGSISGPSTVCMPSTITLVNSMTGGTWSTSNAIVATVNPTTGVVVGLSMGTTNISYHLGGCYNIQTVTVNMAPGTMTGTATVCAGSTTTLATSGALGVWSSSATGIATVGTMGDVYGLAVGTANINYTNACGTANRVVTVTSSCSGTPLPGMITASSSMVCSGTPVTLNLPSYTSACGHVKQWQYSPDGITWYDLGGGTTIPYTFNPTLPNYYRARITCVSSGLTAYSGPVYVGVNFTIGTHSVISSPTTSCLPTDFYVTACGVSPVFSVVTSFGDGESDTTALSTTTVSDAHVFHTYSLPGTYTVRHILFNGGAPVDTVMFSYLYKFCRTLPIGFYRDANSNCAFDATEVLSTMPATVRIDSNGIPIDTLTATSGLYYKALGGPGTIYAFRPISATGGYTITCPASGVIYDTITSFTNTYVTKYFGLGCAATGYDLSVNASSRLAPDRQWTTITVHNSYCFPVTPVVTLNHSGKYGYFPPVFPSAYTFPAPASYTATSITWNMPTIPANSVGMIQAHLSRPASLGGLLSMGDTANYTITVLPTTGDLNPANNIKVIHDTVRASWDPNDMMVTPSGYVLPCTELEYRVRFENAGNDTAYNVYVLDTLPAGLNASTLYPVIASHPMDITVMTSGPYTIAKFDFPNIKLLDSSHHDKRDGMFVFRVKAHIGATDGTVMTNRAGIYFDTNPVVMTNEVTNIIGIAPIEGPNDVCLGYPDTMFNSMPGGMWASSTPATGTVSTIGIVTGIAAGTTTISYTVVNSCTSRTVTKVITVAPIALPTVTLLTADDTVCSGSPVIFTTATTNAGTTPSFTWSVNGLIVGAGSAYSYMPTTGDEVMVNMASSQACTLPPIVSDSITMTVLPTGTPVVLLSVSPNDTTCAGSTATFTANPLMGGSNPGYQWFVNTVLSGTGPSYMYVPNNGDIIYVRMGSNYHCRLADTVVSASIHQTVDPMYIPAITLTASPSLTVNAGDPITFVANTVGAGPWPIFEWYVNSIPVPGVTTGTFTTTTLSDYDSVTCRVTGSGICAITAYEYLFVTILPVGVNNIGTNALINVFPNPSNGGFRIKADFGTVTDDGEVTISVNNVLGQSVYRNVVVTQNGTLNEAVQLPAGIANGVYTLVLRKGESSAVYRMVIDK